MTEKQRRRFIAIVECLQKSYPDVPTNQELTDSIEDIPSKDTMHNVIKALCNRGLLSRIYRTPKSLEVTEKGAEVYNSLVGK